MGDEIQRQKSRGADQGEANVDANRNKWQTADVFGMECNAMQCVGDVAVGCLAVRLVFACVVCCVVLRLRVHMSDIYLNSSEWSSKSET